MGNRWTISGWQMSLMMTVSFLAAGIFTYPRLSVSIGEGSTLFAILLAAAVAMASAVLIAWLAQQFAGLTGVQWNDKLLPVWIGRPLAVVAPATHGLLLVPIMVRLFAELMRTIYFFNTPIWALGGVLLAVAVYGALLGIEAIARVTAITLPLDLFLLAATYLMSLALVEAYRLVPSPPSSIGQLAATTYVSLAAFEGFGTLAMLVAFLNEPKQAIRYTLFSFAIAVPVLLLVYWATVGTFGVNGLPTMPFPPAGLLENVRARGWLVERLGSMVIIIWSGLVVMSCATHIWSIGAAAAQVLGLPIQRYKVFVVLQWPLILTLALLPRNISAVEDVFIWFPAGALFLNVFMPLLHLAVGLARGMLPRRQAASHK